MCHWCIPPANRLEELKGESKGRHSIRINQIVLGKCGLFAGTALRLSRAFGTSEGFWMGLQTDSSMEETRKQIDGA